MIVEMMEIPSGRYGDYGVTFEDTDEARRQAKRHALYKLRLAILTLMSRHDRVVVKDLEFIIHLPASGIGQHTAPYTWGWKCKFALLDFE